jgi:hypothetical protein
VNIALWIIQILLALAFVVHGRVMLSPPETLQPGMAYVRDIAPGTRRVIGVLEILAAVGLILPALTGILPWLTPLAASGLVILMAGAAVYHLPARSTATSC